jgi:hypothetical protein
MDDLAAYADDLVALDRGCARLAWRYGIDAAVTDASLRTREIANWLECQVRPTRSRRGRG